MHHCKFALFPLLFSLLPGCENPQLQTKNSVMKKEGLERAEQATAFDRVTNAKVVGVVDGDTIDVLGKTKSKFD